jgi:NifU-like protein involved in Fe-S cluster formation
MIEDVYNKRILQFAADVPRHERLSTPDGTATAISRLCGSKVTVDVKLEEGGRVADFGQEVKACALGQASSSIMARNVIGSDLAELQSLRAQMQAMLKENGPPPSGKWADLEVLTPVRDFKARHASALLTFDATVEAVEQALTDSTNRHPRA